MKQPLFGQDSSPHYTSRFFGYAGTAVLWLIFIICMIFIKPPKKEPEFKTVQIVLEPLEKTEVIESQGSKSQAAPAPAEAVEISEPAPEPVNLPVVEEPVIAQPPKAEPAPKPVTKPQKMEAPKTKTPAPEPVKKAEPVKQPDPEPYAPPTIYKSAEELMNEQFSQKKQNKKIDFDSMFGDDDFTPVEEKSNKVVAENKTDGSAGVKTTDNKLERASSKSVSDEQFQKASSSTTNAFSNIEAATADGKISNAQGDNTTSISDSGNDKLALSFNGKKRELLDPKKPKIKLQNSHLLDGARSVTITFTVVEAGNVPRGDITITPESVLPKEIRDEIKDQISKWRFEYSDDVSTATLRYDIKIKK